MSILTIPQARIPLGWAVVDGKRVPVEIDMEWMRYLSTLTERAGGINAPRNLNQSTESLAVDASFSAESASIAELSKRTDALESKTDEAPAQLAELAKRFNNMETELAFPQQYTIPWDRPGTIGALTPNTGKFTEATFPAIATPAAPASGNVNIYGMNAPSGVTRLVMQTSTGAELAFFRDAVLTVRNNSGATINKGQMVYITGSNGVVPTIGLAKADSVATARMVGMALANIANNAFGTIQTSGEIRGINTTAFVDGDIVWLSAATAGALTATEPSSPNLAMRIGTIVLSNANGIIQLFLQPAVINWGSPNAIGNGTPAAGTFTTLTATGLLDVSGAAAGQIKFPATQNASANVNTLDDYEEGTWTPVPTSLTVVGTPTYSGKYTKIGNAVICQMRVTSTGTTTCTGGTTTFAGLPFAASVNGSASFTNDSAGSLGTGIVFGSTVAPASWTTQSAATSTFVYFT